MKVPVIGVINTATKKINYYDKVVDYVEFDEKQAQNEDLLSKVAIKKQRSQQKDNSQSLFSKIC